MKAKLHKLLKIRDTAEALARGAAIGLFFGVSLFWGFQIILAVTVSHFLRGNKVIAAAMTAVSNPLTTLPLYSLCYFVGHLIVRGGDEHPDFSLVHSVEGFLEFGPSFFMTMLLGTTVVGLAGAVGAYALIKGLKGKAVVRGSGAGSAEQS